MTDPSDLPPVSNRRIWLAVLPALVIPLIGALIYFVLVPGGRTAQISYGITKVFLLVWPAVVFPLIYRQPIPRPHWGHGSPYKALPLGGLIGLAIVGIMVALLFTPLGDVVLRGGPAIRDKCEALGILKHYFLFGAFVSFIHSLLEEYYWRWFVYGQLSRVVHGFGAHLIAGIGFAAHHVVVVGTYFGIGWGFFFGAMVGVGGIIWSVMMARQKTLLGVWFSHMIVDIGCISVGWWLMAQTVGAPPTP